MGFVALRPIWEVLCDDSFVFLQISEYSKTCLKQPLKMKTKNCFSLLLNADQKYCRMLQGEHSAILSIFIKLPFSIKTFILSLFKWWLKTGFAVKLIIAL